MSEALQFLAAPTVMCLILVGIHCYLGLHVLARGVIFVDLALAQVAALGTTLAFLLGLEHDHYGSYLVSLGLTLTAAFFLALANRLRHTVSQEALIGVLYALATSMVVLLVDRMSHGSEHLKHALTGQILWVTWPQITKVALVYSAVALVHWTFRHRLIALSFEGQNSVLWDFVFYALFGVVITSSVQVAGVLLVFSFLIVPAVISSFFCTGLVARLIFGWIVGFVLSLLGMGLSFQLDLPSGAFIVVVFTLVPFLLVVVMKIFPRYRQS